MSCAFSKELLALHIENDLPDSEEHIVARHLPNCTDCVAFVEQLMHRQFQLKQLRRESLHHSAFANMRHSVMSQIENGGQALGWTIRLERVLFMGFRHHAAVVTSLVFAVIVSATLFAQMRQTTQVAAKPGKQVAVFDGSKTLLRPDGYREWVSVGSSIGPDDPGPHITANASSGFIRNVYIDRLAYREFTNTGKFPEGAVLILETSRTTDKQPVALQASVKDSRFDDGWGFFNFTGANDTIQDKAEAIADKSTCRLCHEKRARFDHVFTQFHRALKTAT